VGCREVDIYAAGRWLTCVDGSAYLPQFTHALMGTVHTLLDERPAEEICRPYPHLSPADNHRRLREDAGGQAYRFMDWGPTTDNVIAHLFIENGVALIPFSFRSADHHDPSERGKDFLAELPERELLRVLHEAAWVPALGHA
jgi:hypothetical protein